LTLRQIYLDQIWRLYERSPSHLIIYLIFVPIVPSLPSRLPDQEALLVASLFIVDRAPSAPFHGGLSLVSTCKSYFFCGFDKRTVLSGAQTAFSISRECSCWWFSFWLRVGFIHSPFLDDGLIQKYRKTYRTMATSDQDQKILGRLAKQTERSNPYLSDALYQILGLSVLLSRRLIRARKLRKLDPSRDTPSLASYQHILWISREVSG